MKILELTTNISSGSVARIVRDMYKEIEKTDNECMIAYARGENKENLKAIKIGSQFDVYVHALLSRITDRSGFYSKKATKVFIEKLEKYKPDIIHIHCLHGYYINIPLLVDYINRNNIPVIWTMHDCWAFTGHCAYFTYVKCEKWKRGCERCIQKHSFPSSYFLDSSRKNYGDKKELFTSINNMRVVTPSKWLSEHVKESFFNKYPISVINNGIDIDTFNGKIKASKQELGLPDKKIILGVANLWDSRKGLKDFIELSQILKDDAQIVLVGLSEKQKRNLPENIIGITRTNSKEELSKLYSVASIFFNPTYEDNYPTVNIEAIACGTPVVTYDTGGSPEEVNEGTGLVIEKKDYASLIKYLERSEEIKAELRNKNIDRFKGANMIEQYLNLINNEIW